MKFVDLNGREHAKHIDYRSHTRDESSRSKLAHSLYLKVSELFPGYTVLEEFPCVGLRPVLHLDFLIMGAGLRIAFEADGRQHKKFTPFFHGTRANFARAKINDLNKDKWCLANSITLIRVESEDDIDNLAETINDR